MKDTDQKVDFDDAGVSLCRWERENLEAGKWVSAVEPLRQGCGKYRADQKELQSMVRFR
jgi:hypothetical protein